MNAIVAEQLGKRYQIHQSGQSKSVSLKIYAQQIFSMKSASVRDFWALRDLNFSIQEGDVVGLVGPNGSGKTTLLRLLSQVAEPTEGKITIKGRVGALLGANTGFHEDLNSIDNIYLSSAIMGFSKRTVDQSLDKIIEFSELDEFIFEPIRHLSSGMQMKLGLSIIMAILPEIIILDEVVGTLDEAFRRKLNTFIENHILGQRTVIIVNHHQEYIQKNCNVVIELNKGKCIKVSR